MTAQEKTITAADGIYAAIPRAMAQIKRLAKDSRNAEQKYDFTSVDDFLAMTGPIMAEAGLFIMMDELAVEAFERQGKYGPTHWLSVTFQITLHHASGQSLPSVKRTVEVIRTGAQSFGSAQSYALKQFQRALFNIPTGDKDDADYGEKGEGAAVNDPHSRAPQRRQEQPEGPSPEAIEAATSSLAAAATLDVLRDVFMALPPAIKSRPEVIKAKDDRKAALGTPDEQPMARAIDDEIPY